MSQPLDNWANGVPVLPLGTGKGVIDTWANGAPVLKKPKQNIRATLARSQTAATIAAAGLEKFLGTLARSQTAATIAATGKEVFTGTLARSQTAATIAATGKEVFTATAALTQSAHTSAETGSEIFTGTGSLEQSAHTLTAAGLVTEARSSFVIASGGIRGKPKKRPYRWGVKAPEPISIEAHLEQAAHRMQAVGTVIARRQPIGGASYTSPTSDFASLILDRVRVVAELAPPIVGVGLVELAPPIPPIPIAASVYVVQSRHTMRARGSMSTERLEMEEALLCMLLLTAANSLNE